jgi:hypothetical protein
VTIAGQNFEEPIEVSFGIGGAGGPVIRPTVTSVSSSLITLVMPAIDPGVGATLDCGDVAGELAISFPTLASCDPLSLPFTYSVNPMTAISASPTQLNQGGGPFGSPIDGAQATITVLGTNFADPTTVEIYGGTGAGIPVNNAIVANSGQLTFTAPAVPDSALNTQPCVPPGGTSVTGTMYVPTSFGIRLRNARTGCTVSLPNVLIYNPADPSCRVAVAITTASLPSATLCSAYGPVTATVAGGVGPFTWSATGLPALVNIDPNTGAISGVPQLAVAGAGGTTTVSVGLQVTDAGSLTSASRTVGMQVIDPSGPFVITAAPPTAIPAAGGNTGAFTVPTSAQFGVVNWTIVSVTPNPPLVAPAPAPGTITLSPLPANGSTALNASATVPAGSYAVVLRATDTSSCGGQSHTATVTYTLTKSP